VWDDALDGWRKRTPGEMPENSAAKWQEMYTTLTDLMLEADDLRRFAAQQVKAIEAKGN
jgi:hypothetical protein